MPVIADQGIFIYAVGNPENGVAARNLAISIRANDPFARIALLYSTSALAGLGVHSVKELNSNNSFDYVIECPGSLLLHNGQKAYELWPRLYAYELSPFRRTLYLDQRSILYRGKRLTALLDQLSGREFNQQYLSRHPFYADFGPMGLVPGDLRSNYGRCADHIYGIDSFVEYFERSKENQAYSILTRDLVSTSPEIAELATDLEKINTAQTIATFQRNRQLESHSFCVMQHTALLNEGQNFGDPSYYGYTFTHNDSHASRDAYQELLKWYAEPRALKLDTTLFELPHAKNDNKFMDSYNNPIPICKSPVTTKLQKTKSNIPNRVHQIWINLDGSNTLPDSYIPMINSWFSHSTHENVLHSNDDLLYLLETDYPQFLEFYNQATYITEKSDICRYLLMHKYGGVYVDADMVCLKPLTALLDSLTQPICMSLEPPAHQFWGRVLVGSAFVASKPGLDIWLELIQFMQHYYKPNSFPVLTTGPIIVDYFLHEHGYKNQIELIDSQYVFPTDTSNDITQETEATICRHEWTGLDTWLAQVPLGIRQALYAKQHTDIDSLHAYMLAATDPNNPEYKKGERKIINDREKYIKQLELALQESQTIVNQKELLIQELDVGLKDAQHIVDERNEKISSLAPALEEAQYYVSEKEKQVSQLDKGLREAQLIVEQRESLIQRLDPALQEAQNFVRQREVRIAELEPAFELAQEIIVEKDSQLEQVHTGLREAQHIVHEQETLINKLHPALQEAQELVRQREGEVGLLHPALQEAQSIVLEKEELLQKLDKGLQEAQQIVKQRDGHIQKLDPALRDAQNIVRNQIKRIEELENGLEEVQRCAEERAKEIKNLKMLRPTNDVST